MNLRGIQHQQHITYREALRLAKESYKNKYILYYKTYMTLDKLSSHGRAKIQFLYILQKQSTLITKWHHY